jgi:uncharacterized protein YxjI
VSSIEGLKDFDSLTIREKKKYPGIPETWTLKPEFCLVNGSDEEVFYVVSEKGSLLGFDLLKDAKTYTLYMVDPQGKEVLYFVRKTGLFSSKTEIFNADEELLGSILKKKGSVKAAFEILDAVGRPAYRVDGPAAAPDSFRVLRGEATVGKISKRWGKVAEEGVSKQAHFGIVFPMGSEPKEKGMLLGMLFLLDFLY